MKYIILFIIGILLGAGLIYGYSRAFKQRQSQPAQKLISMPTPTISFSIEPAPSHSLKGIIAAHSGDILWESRIATEPSKLADLVPIQQGERLVTQETGSATVLFNGVGIMKLSQNADVSFIQTLPVDFVIEQSKGIVLYTVNGTIPVSIRIRSGLITKKSGSIQIAMKDNDPTIIITTIQGTAHIGFNDLAYVSQVFTLHEGQVYEYNSDERTAINIKNK